MTTIVTCYYKLHKNKHNDTEWKYWIENFFMIQSNKIIFTNKETYNIYFKNRNSANTYYYILEFQNFYTYKYLETFKKHHELDHEKIIHNVHLYLIWNEKSNFLKRAIELNYFNTDFFVYCDIGYFRIRNLMCLYRNWPKTEILKSIGNKITLLEINEFNNNELILNNDIPISFQYVNRIGGGIIAGSKKILLEWINIYYKTLEDFIEINRFIGKDQSIMASTYVKNKKIINLVKHRPTNLCQNKWFYLAPYLNGNVI